MRVGALRGRQASEVPACRPWRCTPYSPTPSWPLKPAPSPAQAALPAQLRTGLCEEKTWQMYTVSAWVSTCSGAKEAARQEEAHGRELGARVRAPAPRARSPAEGRRACITTWGARAPTPQGRLPPRSPLLTLSFANCMRPRPTANELYTIATRRPMAAAVCTDMRLQARQAQGGGGGWGGARQRRR